MAPTTDEEAAFMLGLFSGLDASVLGDEASKGPSLAQSQSLSGVEAGLVSSNLNSNNISRDDLAALCQGAEDWNWRDMDEEIQTDVVRQPTRTKSSPPRAPDYKPNPCVRCVVESINQNQGTSKSPETTLIVKLETTAEHRIVLLKDQWASLTEARIGDIINVIGNFTQIPSATPSTPQATITIDSRSNFLIIHPDQLVPVTYIANSSQCDRRPLIQSLISSKLEVTPSLVWGNMLHEVVQSCLAEGRWDKGFIEGKISEVVEAGLDNLIRLGLGTENAKMELRIRAQGLAAFSQRYISDHPRPDAIMSNLPDTGVVFSLAITGLHDAEEDIWSPTYGLKGKIDASLQAIVEEKNALTSRTTSWTMPFEIKTGRSVAGVEHRAQTLLYTLLIAERYGVEVPAGILYYTHSASVIRVPAARKELYSLIMSRNRLATYMMRRHTKHDNLDPEPFLPPTLDDEYTCGKCYSVQACMLYRKAVEGVEDVSSPIAELYDRKTSQLTPKRSEFFKKWEALLSLEEHDMLRFRKELWTMTASRRENVGRCFSNMVVKEFKVETGPRVSKIHRYTYKFVRAPDHLKANSLLNGWITKGDAVTVSIEPDFLALARGFVTDLTPQLVTVGVDHAIDIDAISTRVHSAVQTHENSPIIFRIDKDELSGGIGRLRENLAHLFYIGGDTKRLRLIVDLDPPSFDESTDYLKSLPDDLNEDQKAALIKVLGAKDYALILGMPGTGKTFTIAEIIKVLVANGKTVLLTSYTHSAVDTILSKLNDVNFKILRLGNLDKIHPDVHKHTVSALPMATTIKQFERQTLTPPVVATTCLSIDHALFLRREFDYCIVDEASQISLPTCLGPLRFAKQFVLVGDHFQLPPLVRSKDAKKGGLDVSLFRLLSDAHPEAVVDLTYQYRMNEDIMFLSNKLVYNDRLRCGSLEVARRSLALPKLTQLHATPCYQHACWLEQLARESCKAVFVDTDDVPALESKVGDLVQNQIEAELIYQFVTMLLKAGVPDSQIGIISLYRQQVKLLSHLLQDYKNIEILTADKSQGRDKECIIISMVRSNDSGSIGELLKDWRRLNVSFTRARSKLVLFGSRTTLETSPLMSAFFALMTEKDWILHLPPGAHKFHETISRTSKKRSSGVSKENIIPVTPRKAKKAKVEQGLLKGRPVLREVVMNDLH